MKLIVGLGNPGAKYVSTRHNVGFMLLDRLATVHALSFENQDKFHAEFAKNEHLILLKPLTFMNSSGEAVSAVASFYKISPENIFVVHDDLDIKLGEYKVQKGVGPKIHNGVNSIEECLKTTDFWRVRVGIDNRDPENRTQGEAYVLEDFTQKEKNLLSGVLEKVLLALA